MTENFLLLLAGASPEVPLRWGRFEGRRLIEGGWLESAADVAGLAPEAGIIERVIVLLPGEQVATRRTATLPRNASKARAAAVYVMEDELGEAADNLHVAVASAGDAALAIACKRMIVEGWLAAFVAAGVEPDILSADYLTFTPLAENATVVFDGQRVVAAFEGAGLAAELDLFTMLAPHLFKTAPMRIEAVGDATLRRLLPVESEIDWLGAADDARILAFYGAAVAEAGPPNLLQGQFARKRAFAPAFAPWRRTAVIAASAAALFMAGIVAQALRAEYAASEWTKAARDMHAARFPEDAAADPVDHARAMLANGGVGSSFLALASRFGEAVGKHEAVAIDRIRFNAANGEFAVSVRSTTDTGIDELKATLESLGVATQDSGGYRRSGDHWSGELSARLK